MIDTPKPTDLKYAAKKYDGRTLKLSFSYKVNMSIKFKFSCSCFLIRIGSNQLKYGKTEND